MLVLAVIGGYGWVFGGNCCFLVVMVIMSAYGVCFLGFHVVMVGLWVAKVGFGRLKVVIGGYALKMQS